MATLKAQIENLTGGTLASTVYDDWILACTRTLIDILKPEDLESGSTSVTVSQSAGLDITLYRIWTVLCNGYSAIPRITTKVFDIILLV